MVHLYMYVHKTRLAHHLQVHTKHGLIFFEWYCKWRKLQKLQNNYFLRVFMSFLIKRYRGYYSFLSENSEKCNVTIFLLVHRAVSSCVLPSILQVQKSLNFQNVLIFGWDMKEYSQTIGRNIIFWKNFQLRISTCFSSHVFKPVFSLIRKREITL